MEMCCCVIKQRTEEEIHSGHRLSIEGLIIWRSEVSIILGSGCVTIVILLVTAENSLNQTETRK